ncbi:DUF2846 domain-containing protein [Pantoea endophytica]
MSAVTRYVIVSLVFAGLLSPAFALAPLLGPFGETYRKHQPVTNALSQIVFYRQHTTVTASGGATVYIDGKMHTSLLPGGYTAFCVEPGAHTLGVRLNTFLPTVNEDRVLFQTATKGGRTYFLRIDEQALLGQAPDAVSVAIGENELKDMRKQSHLRSRATTVVPCAFDFARAQPMIDYLLPSELLFISDMRLSQPGREAILDLAVQIRRDHVWINHVRVIMGQPAPAIDESRLLLRQAQIRQALIEADLPANTIQFERSAEPQQGVIILRIN